MTTDFILVPRHDPLKLLHDHFPDLINILDEELDDDGVYYVYARFAESLLRNLHDEDLWARAIKFFDALAETKDSECEKVLVIEIFDILCDNPVAHARLRKSLGETAQSHLLEE